MGAALVDTELEVTDDDLIAMAVDKGMMTLVDEAKQAELLTYLQSHQIHASRASGGSAGNSIIACRYFAQSIALIRADTRQIIKSKNMVIGTYHS